MEERKPCWGAARDVLVGRCWVGSTARGWRRRPLWGKVGNDELRGGSGYDLIGGRGDVIFGGPGIDTCRGARGDRLRSCQA